MNTRQHDLDKMEEDGVDARMRDRVYQQSKNAELESARRLLIEAHKRGDLREVERIEDEIKRRGW